MMQQQAPRERFGSCLPWSSPRQWSIVGLRDIHLFPSAESGDPPRSSVGCAHRLYCHAYDCLLVEKSRNKSGSPIGGVEGGYWRKLPHARDRHHRVIAFACAQQHWRMNTDLLLGTCVGCLIHRMSLRVLFTRRVYHDSSCAVHRVARWTQAPRSSGLEVHMLCCVPGARRCTPGQHIVELVETVTTCCCRALAAL